MMHPVLFRNKCSCGGRLLFVTKSGKRSAMPCDGKADEIEEITRIECELCGDVYSARWDIYTGAAMPIIDKEAAYAGFLIFYEDSK